MPFYGLVIFFLSLAVAVVPHFILPLALKTTGTGALVSPVCFSFYHPDFFLALILCMSSVAFLVTRKKGFLFVTVLWGFLIVLSGFIMEPSGFYTGEKDLLFISAQREAINAHKGIRTFLISTGSLTILVSIAAFFHRPIFFKKVSLSTLIFATIMRKAMRSMLLLSVVTVITATIFASTLTLSGINRSIERALKRLGADLIVAPRGYKNAVKAILFSSEPVSQVISGRLREALQRLPEIKKVSPQFYVSTFYYKLEDTLEEMHLVGIDPETDFTIHPWVSYGMNREQTSTDIIVGKYVKFYPGQTIKLGNSKAFKVLATLDETGVAYFDDNTFMTIESARKLAYSKGMLSEEASSDAVSAYLVQTYSGIDMVSLVKEIKGLEEGIEAFPVREGIASVKKEFSGLFRQIILLISLLWFFGIIAGGTLFAMILNERKREFALFRAMGAGQSFLFKIIFYEVSFFALTGTSLGIILGSLLSLIFKGQIASIVSSSFIYPDISTFFILSLGVLAFSEISALLSGVYPALRAIFSEPYIGI